MTQSQGCNPHEAFAQRGLRCTRQRLALYEALLDSRCHPTADELHRDVRRTMPSLSLATVYNTLEVLCRAGLAYRLPAGSGGAGSGSARYEAARGSHLHICCQRSGQVADVPHDLARRILGSIPKHALARLEQELGFRISQVQVDLIGEYDGHAASPPVQSSHAGSQQ